MKRISILIFTLTFLFLITPMAQAQDYLSLKDEYISNHPEQAIIPFPWEPSTSIRVLPFNYEIPAAPSNNFSVTASRNQFEAASFIVNARKDLSGIRINVTDLYNARGDRIAADDINVRLVKVWYQAGWNIRPDTPCGVLTPELLIKDDSLVNVDYVTKTNYLKVTINGIEQYIDISNPTAKFPANAQIHDTPSLQPFSLKANENKQIWLTVHVPNNTPAGDYYGNIILTNPSESPVMMNFSVKVLPFDLDPAPIEYALYYRGKVTSAPFVGIDSENKTESQYAIELANMKNHGVLYPTAYNGYYGADSISNFERSIYLRNASGLPKDHIYLYDSVIQYDYQLTSNPAELNILASKLLAIKEITKTYGFGDVYAYGYDEPSAIQVPLMRPSFTTVIKNGAKTYFPTSPGSPAISLADVTSLIVLACEPNSMDAALWRAVNPNIRIFSYANPQVGIENPEIYRKNYGFTLWNAGYDGAMDYAYQHSYGHIWNDFDDISWRDHVFAYPTSNGVIDTIQWEGWREGVDDTRYLATLIKLEGCDTSAHSIISDSLSKGDDMATIREKIIERILVSSLTNNEQPTIGIFRYGVFYLKNSNTGGPADLTFGYGNLNGDIPLGGDWMGNGRDTIGVFRNGVFHLRNNNSNGAPDLSFAYGAAGDVPVAGDWDGNGVDTVGVFRNGNFYLRNSNSNGAPDLMFAYGAVGDVPVVGDWDGNGIDTIGVFRNGNLYLRNSNTNGAPDLSFVYGAASDVPVVGDWDGNGIDTIGVFRNGRIYLRNNNSNGAPDLSFAYGAAGDVPVAGDWDGM